MNQTLPDLDYLKNLLQVLHDGRVASFKCNAFELAIGHHVSSSATTNAQPTLEDIELIDDLPTEDEILFAASGFQVNRE
jgi:hypothetical protein